MKRSLRNIHFATLCDYGSRNVRISTDAESTHDRGHLDADLLCCLTHREATEPQMRLRLCTVHAYRTVPHRAVHAVSYCMYFCSGSFSVSSAVHTKTYIRFLRRSKLLGVSGKRSNLANINQKPRASWQDRIILTIALHPSALINIYQYQYQHHEFLQWRSARATGSRSDLCGQDRNGNVHRCVCRFCFVWFDRYHKRTS